MIFGAISALLVFVGGQQILAGTMTLGDFVMYVFFIGLLVAPLVRISDDRHPDERGLRRPRPDPGAARARHRGRRRTRAARPCQSLRGDVEF